eukprot:scaffold2141_cov282-Pinguiococcus_pyrenoidosus.AAC.19
MARGFAKGAKQNWLVYAVGSGMTCTGSRSRDGRHAFGKGGDSTSGIWEEDDLQCVWKTAIEGHLRACRALHQQALYSLEASAKKGPPYGRHLS